MLLEQQEEFYAFAGFRLYPKLRTLMRDEQVIAIGGRAFDMLLVLVSRAGEVVALSDLMAAVWPNVTVEEANLRVQMGSIRKILSACPDAERAIDTVPLRGYCFIVPVHHHARGLENQFVQGAVSLGFPTLLNNPVGRDDAILLVSRALAESRLVTITGPGGIGKTTVAIATANRLAETSCEALAFVDLSQIPVGGCAAETVSSALGMPSAENAMNSLCEALRGSDMLLVLDTCEHIVEPVAALAETLLRHCPSLKILATSREILRAAGEWTFRLPSLTFPGEEERLQMDDVERYSAMSLFVERIRSCADLTPGEQHLATVAEICRRLDGIPLALELAAARVVDMGLGEIAARLDDYLAILTRGRRTAFPRHRTLAATLDWSYRLLSDEEQQVMRHLSKFSGSFSARDAIASAGRAGCPVPAEALVSLYDKSLLAIDIRNDRPAYRLLDMTRSYVASL